jgi:alpha-mannosidase
MGSHFHDIAAGTAIPKAYEYAWNDQILSLNQFAGVLADATDAVASVFDTRAQGVPVVVYNPLNVSREDVVEANLSFRAGSWQGARVFDGAGVEVPAQLGSTSDGNTKVFFLAKVPSVGYAVFDVRPATSAGAPSALSVNESSLENARYRVGIDANGDIASIFDKTLRRELLRAPMRLALQTESPAQWPAWSMDWDDASAPPRAYVAGPAAVRVVERGPVRVALQIERTIDSSRFVQTVRLSAGDAGNRVEIGNAIDWRGDSAALKATFPLTATNDSATYNWDVGTIKRGTMYDRKFEVPSHHFIDLTDGSGTYGVTVLTDAKNGSDKPDANTLRLTLLYSPGISQGGRGYAVQRWQDWGHHDINYGLVGHGGDFRRDQTDWQAWRFSQPLIAFESPKHPGTLGKTFSLARISEDRVRMMALKKAEHSDEVIVRLVEIGGRNHSSVRISFPVPLAGAREVDGQEQPIGSAMTTNGALVTSLTPYMIRSFAVKLRPGTARVSAPSSRAVPLVYDASVASHDGTRSAGGFDAAGRAMPAEMPPERLPYNGITFSLAPAKEGVPNAVIPRGQSVALPSGNYNRLYVLAAADGDQQATFAIGDRARMVIVQDWTGYVGQWDNRVFKQVPPSADDLARFAAQQARQDSIRRARIDSVLKAGGDTTAFAAQFGRGGRGQQGPRMVQVYDHLTPGFVKRAPVAWFASHRHTADGANEPYQYSYLFAYSFDVPPGAKTLTLPNNDRIRILAVTVANQAPAVRAVQPLSDTLERQ